MKTLRLIFIVAAGMLLLNACKTDDGVKDRCGNTYPIVKIGEQVWMAENLRCNKYDSESEAYKVGIYTIPTSDRDAYTPYYTDASDKSDFLSVEYAKFLTDAQMAQLGYLYNWAAAVGIADGQNQSLSFIGNRQGICPNGWHLPSVAEWQTLENYVKKQWSKSAGKHLKTTSGWYVRHENYDQGLDSYDFAVLPSGRFSGENVLGVGDYACFWSDTQTNSYYAYCYELSAVKDGFEHDDRNKQEGKSVRCIMNTDLLNSDDNDFSMFSNAERAFAFIPDHSKVKAEAKSVMSQDLYDALSVAWDVPQWFQGIGDEEFLYYFMTGNGDDGIGPIKKVVIVSKSTDCCVVDLIYYHYQLSSFYSEMVSVETSMRLVMVKDNGEWLLDDFGDGAKQQCINYITSSVRDYLNKDVNFPFLVQS